MERTFLYIDILGFSTLVKNKSEKVDQIFRIIDSLKVYKDFKFQVIVFSDTLLVFNKDESQPIHVYITFLVEYAQQLFYKLLDINIYSKGILTFGEFKFSKLRNIEAYYGMALINAYNEEKELEGFGLYVDKRISEEIITFEKTNFSEKYDFVFLCQSVVSLYDHVEGILPVDLDLFTETDTYFRIEEDLKFFREIRYLKEKHSIEKVRNKYRKVYDMYKERLPLFFDVFELEEFLPFALNSSIVPKFNPFTLSSEEENA